MLPRESIVRVVGRSISLGTIRTGAGAATNLLRFVAGNLILSARTAMNAAVQPAILIAAWERRDKRLDAPSSASLPPAYCPRGGDRPPSALLPSRGMFLSHSRTPVERKL